MKGEEVTAMQKALERERARRHAAEQLLEEKSRELFESYQQLEAAHQDLKANQKQLVRSEKMASLGVLSAGVAHEINNPVGFVLSNINTLTEYAPVFGDVYIELKALLEKIDDDSRFADDKTRLLEKLEDQELDYLIEDTTDLLSETRAGLVRVRDIVAGLKNFTHSDTSEMVSVDLNHCVQSTLSLVNNQLKYACKVTAHLADDLPTFVGNEGRIGQVVMNMLVNASQAVGSDAGEITVTTTQQDDELVLRIADNGHGIEPQDLEKLFTPFFTTKPVGEGTGLGLSISFGIIEEHQGRIEVSSTVGEGTEFSVFLPTQPTST